MVTCSSGSTSIEPSEADASGVKLFWLAESVRLEGTEGTSVERVDELELLPLRDVLSGDYYGYVIGVQRSLFLKAELVCP